MNEKLQTIESASIGGLSAMPFMAIVPHPEMFLFSLFPAIFVTVMMSPYDTRAKTAAAVMLATMVGGFGAYPAADIVTGWMPVIAGNADSIRGLCAVILSSLTPSGFPVVAKALVARAEKKLGE